MGGRVLMSALLAHVYKVQPLQPAYLPAPAPPLPCLLAISSGVWKMEWEEGCWGQFTGSPFTDMPLTFSVSTSFLLFVLKYLFSLALSLLPLLPHFHGDFPGLGPWGQ